MSFRSFDRLYALASAGSVEALQAHIAELVAEVPEDKEPANWALIAAAEANQIDTVRALLMAGANIEGAADRTHIRPLWKAAKRGHLQMVQLLIASGACVAATDGSGMTALDYAKRYSHGEVVRYLESRLAKPD